MPEPGKPRDQGATPPTAPRESRGGEERFVPQRRPEPKQRPVLAILLGMVVLLGFGAFALFTIAGFFFGDIGSILGGIRFRSHPVALVRIDAIIQPGPRFDFWMQSLEAIGRDEEIRGIVLRIDTPGGTVASSQELYDEILNLREKHGKKVYASMGDVAASGGYYLAAAADRIFANRGTLTGSVGVISTVYRIDELAERYGVGIEVIKKGRFKDTGSMFRPMTPEDRQVLDLLITDTYDQFVDDILSQRSSPLAEALVKFEQEDAWESYLFEKPDPGDTHGFLLQIADGRAYSGQQALKLGLVDDLGSLSRTLEELASELGIPGRPRVFEPQRRVSFFDMLTMKVQDIVPKAWTYPTLEYRMIPF